MLAVKFTFTCDHCGQQRTSDWTIALHPGVAAPAVVLPDGWQVVNGTHVCARHQVVVQPVSGQMTKASRDAEWLVQPCANPNDKDCNCPECQAVEERSQ